MSSVEDRLVALLTPRTTDAPSGEIDEPPLEREAIPAAVAVEARPDAPAEPATAELRVLVVRADTRAPLAGEEVALQANSPDEQGFLLLDGSRGELGSVVVSDADGRAAFAVPPGEASRLLSFTAVLSSDTWVAIEPLAAGETREVELPLPAFDQWIRVVDAADGGPILGAVIRPSELRREAQTGVGGLASLVVTHAPRTAEVEAEGYGAARVLLEPGHGSPEVARTVELNRGACLVARVLDGEGEPLRNARIELGAADDDLLGTSASARTIGAFRSSGRGRWSTRTSESGTARLCGLPSGVPLRVVVSRGARLRFEPREPLVLAPGEEHRVEYVLGEGAQIVGLAADERGEPVAGVRLDLAPLHHLHDEASFVAGIKAAESKADGGFRFHDVHAGTWELSVDDQETRWTGEHVRIEVAEGATLVETRIELRSALAIRGVVLGPDDEPVDGAFLITNTGVSASSDADGRFELAPLLPGAVRIDAIGVLSGYVLLAPLELQAGTEDAVVRVLRGASLSGVLIDAATGEPTAGWVDFTTAAGVGGMATASADGRFSVGGLEPGPLSLLAGASGDRVGWRANVEIPLGGEVTGIEVLVAPGGWLRLEHDTSEPMWIYGVSRDGARLLRDGSVEASVRVGPLPAGRVVVERFEGGEAPAVSREVDVKAGETATVALDD